ncbi:MAG: DMT family transporter [Aestuariivirga sp.]|nr:DMT family transporter [Aestuariivirga sp.]
MSPAAGQHVTGVAAASLAALCWASATVLSKAALQNTSPVLLLTLQLIVSNMLLWGVILVLRRRLPPRPAAGRIALLGLLEPGLAYLLGLIGLVSVGAGVATLIQASEAIMILVLAAVLLAQPLRVPVVVSSLVALAGLAMALGLFDTGAGENDPTGVILIFVATAAAAVYVTLSARIAANHDTSVIVGLQQLSALVLALTALPADALLFGGLAGPSGAGEWTVVIISGVLQYAVAFSLYMYALARISAGLAGSCLNLTPVFGLVLAFLLLGEVLTGLQLLGAVITILAVGYIHLRAGAVQH